MDMTAIKNKLFIFDLVLAFLVIVFIFSTALLVVFFFTNPEYIGHVLFFGFLLWLGFFLPNYIGKVTRLKNSEKSKVVEALKWNFCSRNRDGPWINYIDYPVFKITHFAENRQFYSEWLIIHQGQIIINPGMSEVKLNDKTVEYDYTVRRAYSWDGCTPKKWFFWIILFGTPDFWHSKDKVIWMNNKNIIETKDVFWQKAHHASLVHDALYQYLGEQPISKVEVDYLFYEMLRDSGVNVVVATIYHFFVHTFGAWDIDEYHCPDNTELTVKSLPQ